MSAQAVIFQKQLGGWYKGVSVQYDGDIGYVGRILNSYYNDTYKTDELIRAKKCIKTLGIEPEFKHYSTIMEWRKDRTAEGWNTYTEQWKNEEGYFVAETLEDIRDFRYFGYSADGKIKGTEYETDIVIPFQDWSPDYLYIQDGQGEWWVGQVEDTEFYPLETEFRSEAEQAKRLIDMISVFHDTEDYLDCTNDTQAQFEHELATKAIRDITPDIDGILTDDDIIEALTDDMKANYFVIPDESFYKALFDYKKEHQVFTLNNRLYIRE